MAGVYVFNYDDTDLDTTGLVGDLQPIECIFNEEKNGESVLTMRLCYDPLNKWSAVKVGSYIKAQVPVRVPPKITNNMYDHEIMTYKVKDNVTYEVTVWESCGVYDESAAASGNPMIYRWSQIVDNTVTEVKKQVKKKCTIPAGTEVQVLEQRSDGLVKVYGSGFGTGWTLESNLEYVVSSTIPDTFYGVESVVTPTRLQYQLFQVTNVEQTLDNVSVTAQHVFYELLHNVTNFKSDTPTEAFHAINGAFDSMLTVDERFTCRTDASHKAGTLYYQRANMVQVLLDPEEGICAQYGLSLLRDNYDIYALKNVGSDRGFVVEYGKNMLSVERIEDISNVVTRIVPFGRTKQGVNVFLDDTLWVDSPRIMDYSFPRTMYLDCADTATESDTMTLEQVKAELKARAEAEFAAGCDLPVLSMTVDFISMGDTEEYKQYRGLDKVYLFDRVTVKDKVRGYDYNAEVVAITHNVLTGQLESVTLGSIQKGTGVRKIATWQVPEVDGGNIRLESIAPGVLGNGAVGSDNLQPGSVGTQAIAAYSITTEKLAAGAITADKLAAGAISADIIEAGSITTDKLAAGAVTADKIAAGAITSDFIEAGSITADKIATGTITAESGIIAAGAVGTAQIADGSITDAKIVGLTANKITAGTLDASQIAVVNLVADNITTGTINGQLIPVLGSDKLEAGAVTAGKIAENAVTADTIVSGAVTTDKLAANAVTANNILTQAVTADKIAANAVTADKIAAGAITTAKISSDFASSLDLSSNKSINMMVGGGSQTYVQASKPVGQFKTGDTWVKTAGDLPWSELQSLAWGEVDDSTWTDFSATGLPRTYVWDGEDWVLTVDYNEVQDNKTSITQTQNAIKLKAEQAEVDLLTDTVEQQYTLIQQNAEEIKLKASKGDPVEALETSTVTINAEGVNIKTGGTFTVESGNFALDDGGNMSAQNAYLSGDIFVNGSQALSKRDVYFGTVAPVNPVSGMIWIKPSSTTSTNARTTFSLQIPWERRDGMVNEAKTGTLTGTSATASGSNYTYKIRVPVYIRKYTGDSRTTGGVFHFELMTSTTGSAAVSATKEVTISDYGGEGNKVIEMEVTSRTWLGNRTSLYFKMYVTSLSSSYYAGNILNSSDTSASITVECISKSTSTSGWQTCTVQYYP